MGVARVLVTPELLALAMCFPEGTRIINASLADRYVVLTVEHPDLRAAGDAAEVPGARPTYRRDDAHPRPGLTFIGWGQE